jgi:hypothetical protein
MTATALHNALCQDKVTGFTGICTAVVFYATGCHAALLVPRVDEKGLTRESLWFDLQRIEVLQHDAVAIDNGNTPGGDAPAPGGSRA